MDAFSKQGGRGAYSKTKVVNLPRVLEGRATRNHLQHVHGKWGKTTRALKGSDLQCSLLYRNALM
jgi:hypothetical protein